MNYVFIWNLFALGRITENIVISGNKSEFTLLV